jgi:putative flippase GtrA
MDENSGFLKNNRLIKALMAKLRKNPKLDALLSPKNMATFARYLIVGFSTFAVEYTLFLLLRMALPFPELVVNVMVYTVVFWFNFLLNKFFAFQSKVNFKKQLFSYGILFFFNMIAGNILLFSAIRSILVLISGEGSWPVLYLPKILIMVFIVSWNFILYKKVIYK